MIRHALLVLALAGCSTLPPAPTRPTGDVIASADDVRWPRERRTFVGTIHRVTAEAGTSIAILELADDVRPALVALGAGDAVTALAEGDRVAVSGIGRRAEAAESAAGATIALRDVSLASDGAPDALRVRTDLEVEVRKTRLVADGVLVARPSPMGPSLLLALPEGMHVPVMVTVDGAAEANARVGQRVRVSAYLMPTPDELRSSSPDVVPGLTIAQPAFE